jgi:hypothetical protein
VVESREGLSDLLAQYLRAADVVVHVRDQLVVALPETPAAGAVGLRDRLSEGVPGMLFRIASLPDDGTELRALLAVAR